MGLFLTMSIFVLRYFLFPVFLVFVIAKLFLRRKQKVQNELIPKIKLAFFHPYCNAAGGGEKVLWCLLFSLFTHMKYIDQFSISIFTGDTQSPQEILEKASARFNINLIPYINKIEFVRVSGRRMLEPYKFATMIFQLIGTMIYTFKCIWQLQPHIFFDTTGFAFSYIVVKKLLNCRVISYTHYPFISSDMISKVKNNQKSFNNNSKIASSFIFSKLKLVYYFFLTQLYKSMGGYLDMTFTNSSWTDNHIKSLWRNCRKENTITESIRLFPPCNVSPLLKMEKDTKSNDQIQIMSFAQFRPEKDHSLQIKVFERVLARLSDQQKHQMIFKIVGSVRNEDDDVLLNELENQVVDKNLEHYISFVKNPPFKDLIVHFKESDIGLHTMKDEHFGIAVVELMAAGIITIAHKSAGPLKDIIQTNEYGYLCDSEDDYVEALLSAIQLSKNQKSIMREKARKKAQAFSDEEFMVLGAAHFENFVEYYQIV